MKELRDNFYLKLYDKIFFELHSQLSQQMLIQTDLLQRKDYFRLWERLDSISGICDDQMYDMFQRDKKIYY